VWAERERGREGWEEGTNERGEVGEQGTRLKRGTGARTWPENAWTWARPRRGDRGREVEDELTGGDGGTEREADAHARGRRRQAWPTEQREREGERGRAGWRRHAGPACQAQGTRERARGGWANGPTRAEIGFPFSMDFLTAFLFIFSRVFNSNSNQVSNSNQIKYMQQFKEYLGSI
jgi:hypothetical protein